EPGLAGQDDRREYVVDAQRHRDDVRLDDLRPEPVLRLADGLEDPERLASRIGQRYVHSGQWSPAGQFPGEQLRTLRAGQHLVVRYLVDPLEELGEYGVVRLGVLAYVHRGQVRPEGRDGPDHLGELPGRGEL